MGPLFRPVVGDVLEYDDVMARFDGMMDWLARTYVHAMNCIHYSHDRYNYERLMMALHDRDIVRTMAFGIAGLSVAADSLSAIKYAKVKPIRREDGLVTDFEITGDFPKFGNNDPRVDNIAADLVKRFMNHLRKLSDLPGRGAHAVGADHHLQCGLRQEHRQHARWPPPGRTVRAGGEPDARPRFARLAGVVPFGRASALRRSPGRHQLHAFHCAARDPAGREEAVTRACDALDMYFGQGGFHMNLNVLRKETLLDAMEHPDKYPQLTIRVSGYAVNFVRLTREQQLDVIGRSFFHGSI